MMRLLTVLLLSLWTLPALAEDCDAELAKINDKTAEMLSLRYEKKADYDAGTAAVENEIDGLMGNFNRLKKTSECRAPWFHALTLLNIAALPFDQENIGGQFTARVITATPALETESKGAIDDYLREHQGQRALSCRGSTFKDEVTAQLCRRDTKKVGCFAKLHDFAKCAELPEHED